MSFPAVREPEVQSLLNKCFFKFGPYGYVERTLENKTLGFGTIKSFNDISEYEFHITHFFNSPEDWKKLLDPPVNSIDIVEKKIKSFLDQVRVTCFTLSPFNNLMWSHYAEHHSGVCYCFDKAKIGNVFPGVKLNWGTVIYSSHVPEVTVFQEGTTEGALEALIARVIRTKSSDCSYENEFRFFSRGIDSVQEYDPEVLKAVIIGRRTNDNQVDEISKQVDAFNAVNGTDVRILFAHRRAGSFELGVDSDKEFRANCETNFNAGVPVLENSDQTPVTTIVGTD